MWRQPFSYSETRRLTLFVLFLGLNDSDSPFGSACFDVFSFDLKFQHHFDAYMNHYKKKLESVSGPTYQSQIGDEVNLDQLLGARKQYYTVKTAVNLFVFVF